MPLRLFRLRNLNVANVVGILWAAAMFAWFFLSALYLQLVLGYSPLEVGLAFLPGNLVMMALSIGVSAKLVMRFGIRLPLSAGLSIAALGLLLFARAPVDGSFLVDVLPSMVLLGLGAGIAFNPVLLAAMGDVEPAEAGLASGVVNTAFMMGGALGLAVLASLADSRSGSLLEDGESLASALTGGYHLAFLIGAGLVIAAIALYPAGYRPFSVLSGSMEPALGTGDVSVVRTIAPLDARPGDIVTFRDPGNSEKLITHRVRTMRAEGDGVFFITRGDANNVSERWRVEADGEIGRVVYRIPEIGWALMYARTQGLFIILLGAALALLLVLELGAIWRPDRSDGAPVA
jgi:signal peptidase I